MKTGEPMGSDPARQRLPTGRPRSRPSCSLRMRPTAVRVVYEPKQLLQRSHHSISSCSPSSVAGPFNAVHLCLTATKSPPQPLALPSSD
jgi:hypothetical protein